MINHNHNLFIHLLIYLFIHSFIYSFSFQFCNIHLEHMEKVLMQSKNISQHVLNVLEEKYVCVILYMFNIIPSTYSYR